MVGYTTTHRACVFFLPTPPPLLPCVVSVREVSKTCLLAVCMHGRCFFSAGYVDAEFPSFAAVVTDLTTETSDESIVRFGPCVCLCCHRRHLSSCLKPTSSAERQTDRLSDRLKGEWFELTFAKPLHAALTVSSPLWLTSVSLKSGTELHAALFTTTLVMVAVFHNNERVA